MVKACKDELGIGIGESTEDGKFFLREFECLGACANAPILWVDDDFYEDLDYDEHQGHPEGPQSRQETKARLGSIPTGLMPIEGRTTSPR